MITIISGTNRAGNRTRRIVDYYREALIRMGEEPEILLPEGIDLNQRTPELERIEEEILIPSEKFIFILPEYNGSFPGAIKTLIDMCRIPECFYGKKALLTGVADGRAGNLRGMEHFTGILNHMKVVVHPNKLPISLIKKLVNDRGELIDEATRKVIDQQLREFLLF
jgi:NAD(P)H-dependent FMN reductase